MNSKYVDVSSIVQVIGSIFNSPNILDNDYKYHFNEEDFPEQFHKILFGSIYNLHVLGADKIDINNIEDYLSQRPKKLAIYQNNKGAEYLTKISQMTQVAAFDYYYNRMKKMTLFRAYESIGMDLTWLYDPDNILDTKKKQKQEEWLDNTSIDRIAELIDQKIFEVRLKYTEDNNNEVSKAGEGALELLEELKKIPAYGYPLYGPLINSVTRGARLGKFYLRSSSSGLGKSRSMIADSCFIACNEIYDSNKRDWIKNGSIEPTLYIATEQEKDEVQTMMIAFISDVDEEHIIDGTYGEGEWDRVVHAAEVLAASPLYTQTIPDFSLRDIENAIKHGIHEFNATYVFFDYIFSSMKILSEVSEKANVKNLREDNILFMIGARLKDLALEYNIFIMSASQLSGDYKNTRVLDQSFLRGAKSLADKADVGMIMVYVNQEDKEVLKPIIDEMGIGMPAIKLSVYKNRRGKYVNIILWCKDERGTCKIKPMFATTYDYELVKIDDLKIEVKEG